MNRSIKMTAVALSMAALLLGACGKSKGSGTPTASSTAVQKDATIAAEVPAAIASKGTLNVATDASYAPDEFFDTDNKTIIGMDIDLMNAIAAVMGLKTTYTNQTFKGIIPSLQAGRFDLSISSFTDNTDREKVVDFVDYFQAGASIFVKSDSTDKFTSLDQLCGKAVSVEKGTTELDDANAGRRGRASPGHPGPPSRALGRDDRGRVRHDSRCDRLRHQQEHPLESRRTLLLGQRDPPRRRRDARAYGFGDGHRRGTGDRAGRHALITGATRLLGGVGLYLGLSRNTGARATTVLGRHRSVHGAAPSCRPAVDPHRFF